MKKIVLILTLALTLLTSCSHNNAPVQKEEPQKTDALQIQRIGGYTELNRAFIDPVEDIHYCVELYGDKVYTWVNEEYLKQTREEMNSTPALYQAIIKFNTTKEELLSVRDAKLTPEIIDALFLPESEMKIALASDTALIYEGEVMSYYDVFGLWDDGEKHSKAVSVPQDVLDEYSDKMSAYTSK